MEYDYEYKEVKPIIFLIKMPYKDKEKRLQLTRNWRKRKADYLREWRRKKRGTDSKWVAREQERKHLDHLKYTKIPYPEYKKEIVGRLGGKCVICGYDEYIGALDLHEKEKIFHPVPSSLLRSLKGFNFLMENLDKLMLVCKNCHAELHNGKIQSFP